MKNYIWIVESSGFPFVKWNPIIKWGGGTNYSHLTFGTHYNRRRAREAAHYMFKNNQYNHPKLPIMVKYRVRKYIKMS